MVFKLDGRPVVDVSVSLEWRQPPGVWREVELLADVTLDELAAALRADEGVADVGCERGALVAQRGGDNALIAEYGEVDDDGHSPSRVGTLIVHYADDGAVCGFDLREAKPRCFFGDPTPPAAEKVVAQ